MNEGKVDKEISRRKKSKINFVIDYLRQKLEPINELRFWLFFCVNTSLFHIIGFLSGKLEFHSFWEKFQSSMPAELQSIFSIQDIWLVSLVNGLKIYLLVLAFKFYTLHQDTRFYQLVIDASWMCKVISFLSSSPIWLLFSLASYLSGLILHASIEFAPECIRLWIVAAPIYFLGFALRNPSLDKSKMLSIATKENEIFGHVFVLGASFCFIYVSVVTINEKFIQLGGYLINLNSV